MKQKTKKNVVRKDSGRQLSQAVINHRIDGWVNILTNLNRRLKDKTTGAYVEQCIIGMESAEALYQSGGIAAKIVDRPALDMTREGFDLIIKDNEENLSDQMLQVWEEKNCDAFIEEAKKNAAIYGGAALILGVNDGQTMDKPIDENNIKSIDWMVVLDRYSLNPGPINRVLGSKNYQLPEYYTLATGDQVSGQKGTQIHHSRVIRFEGNWLPNRLKQNFNYWGDSVYSRIAAKLRDYDMSSHAAAVLVQDFSRLTIKIPDLADKIAGGDDQAVIARFMLLAQLGSMVNGYVYGENEEIDRKTTNVSGLDSLIKAARDALVEATDFPHTILFNESPSGLGATGNHELEVWYDNIKNRQESELRPVIMKIFRLLFLSKDSPTNGVLPKKFSVEFKSLWQMSEKEIAEIRELHSRADERDINSGVLTPEEVANSRYGSGKFSSKTTLDHEAREALEPDEVDDSEDDAEEPQES